jgi:hypothetical protein
MFNQPNRFWHVINLCVCAALWLSACGQAGVPLQITNVSVSPEPIVGQIVTLTVEIMSTHDEPDVTFTLNTLEEYGNKLHLVSGEPEWAGSLTANQTQAFQFSVCVWEEGSWPIRISAISRLPDGNGWDASEIINLESSISSGRLIRDKDFRMTSGATPTARPISVSPECSGQAE